MARQDDLPLLPDRVLLVGDSHGNRSWWEETVTPAAVAVAASAVVQLGDFGWWSSSKRFREVAASGPLPVFFLDGNHEDHRSLQDLTGRQRKPRPVRVDGSLWYLPRGSRLRMGSLVIAAVGGAHSIDRALRRPGVDWFPEEGLDDRDARSLALSGRADVLLSHDAPAGWEIPGLLPDAALPMAWRSERPACEAHRRRLRQVFEAMEPVLVVHGHYHIPYDLLTEENWGPVRVHGLAEDGSSGSISLLTTADGLPTLTRVV